MYQNIFGGIMDKKLVVFFVAAAMILSLSSLGFSQGPLKFGFRGGLNMASVTYDVQDEVDYIEGQPVVLKVDKKMRNTFGFGGFMEYWFSPMFALQFNALYNMKGVKITGKVDETLTISGIAFNVKGEEDQIWKVSYLSFPILAKIAFAQNSSVRPYLMAGPEIGILLSAKTKMEGEVTASAMGITQTESYDDEEDIKDNTESMEFALNFGGGIIIPLGSIEMFIDARYGLGLTKVNKESMDGDDIKNKVIYINIGLIFGGK